VLAALGCWSYRDRTVPVLAGLLAYGALIEVLQALTPYRMAEWTDLFADGVAGAGLAGRAFFGVAQSAASMSAEGARSSSSRARDGL
jgi:VanZ family protein